MNPQRLASLVLCCTAGSAIGQTGASLLPLEGGIIRVILDDKLIATQARILSIDAEKVEAVAMVDGMPMTLPLERVSAILPVRVGGPTLPREGVMSVQARRPLPPEPVRGGQPDAQPQTPRSVQLETGWLRTTSGGVYAGVLGEGRGEAEAVAWSTTTFGVLTFDLEEVLSISLRPSLTGKDPRSSAVWSPVLREASRTSDVVLLANGDTRTGFVEIAPGGEGVIRVTPSDPRAGGTTVSAPTSSIAGIVFANPELPPAGPWAWLADGSAVRADDFSMTEKGMRLASAGGEAAAASAESLIAFVPARERIVPLTALPQSGAGRAVVVQRDDNAFAADILCRGPQSVSWTLPAGASRVGFDVELPERSRAFGAYELLVTFGKDEAKPSWRADVHAGAPTSRCSLEVPGALRGKPVVMTIRLVPGPSGVVQDECLLLWPVVRTSG